MHVEDHWYMPALTNGIHEWRLRNDGRSNLRPEQADSAAVAATEPWSPMVVGRRAVESRKHFIGDGRDLLRSCCRLTHVFHQLRASVWCAP